MERAYSVFTIKSVDDEQRIVRGVATTPAVDRVGDVVEPKGAKFTLPIPFRYEHHVTIGEVFEATVSEEGIEIAARVSKDAAGLRITTDELDRAWKAITGGLVKAFSVGISADPSKQQKTATGIHFVDWFLSEVSAVLIPANIEATIQTIKSFDERAASGNGVVRLSAKAIARLNTPKRVGCVYLSTKRKG